MGKELLGKLIGAVILVVFMISCGMVLSSIFSNGTNVDMFIVWMIFAAEGIKDILNGAWTTFLNIMGFLALVIYGIYSLIKILAIEEKELAIDNDGEPRLPDREFWTKEEEIKFKRWGKPFLKIGIGFMVLSFFMQFLAAGIPNAKQAAVIYIVPKIINNKDMQEIPPNLAKLVNEGLKDMISSVQNDASDAIVTVKEEVKEAVKETIQDGAEKINKEIKSQ